MKMTWQTFHMSMYKPVLKLATFIHFCAVQGCFRCDGREDPLGCKIYYLALHRKSLPTPVLEKSLQVI